MLDGLLQRCGSTGACHRGRALAAAVLGGALWWETSWKPPLTHHRACIFQGWVASGQTTNRKIAQPHPSEDYQIKVLLIPAHQSKTQFFPLSVHPIRKLTQASQPHPSEGMQKKPEAAVSQQLKIKPYYRKLIMRKKAESYISDEGTSKKQLNEQLNI